MCSKHTFLSSHAVDGTEETTQRHSMSSIHPPGRAVFIGIFIGILVIVIVAANSVRKGSIDVLQGDR